MKNVLVIWIISMKLYIIMQAIYVNAHFNLHEIYGMKNNIKTIPCRSVKKEWAMNMKKAECKLRETLVEVAVNDEHHNYSPDYVVVNRCVGISVSPNICVPKNVTMKKFVVRQITANHIMKCHVVHVKEHTLCGSDCKVVETDCNEKQEYMKGSCKCVCIDIDEMNKCKETKNMMWDEKECKCKCNYIEPCGTNNEWVPSLCRCVKIMQYENNYVGVIMKH